MPKITAQLNYLRISPRKVRAAAGLIKGLDVDAAAAQLRYLPGKPAKPLLKLLNSAVSNARHLGFDKNYLYIKEITVNEGMKLKRYKPKGFSLMMPIQKKTSHVGIVLEELPENRRKKKEEVLAKMPKFEEVKKEPKVIGEKKEAKADHKPKIKKEAERVSEKRKFGGIRTLGRKLFRRKTV